ncbi:GTP-binding protein Era [Microbacteriaceae bacterium MWH-Ta3]|nr:GTP-binding protein Era [Microbacteriaceae bacterium MWH-Ta3]
MTGRSGFISFVGRPNVGKSTLMNALVGEKIAITSSKPQTTRRAIRGIVTKGDDQIIIVDTPGLHRPRTLLGERLNALVESTLGDVDVIGMCLPACDPIGPGDRYIIEQLARYPRSKRIAIVTKTDTVSPTQVLDKLTEIKDLLNWDLVVPLSGKTGDRVDVLIHEIIPLLPESPHLYDEADITDEKSGDRISELVREAALEELADELPHSLAVTLEDIVPGVDGAKMRVYVNVIVERDSQKGIIIGHRGSMLRLIGERSRPAIEKILGEPVFLALHVKVAKDWQRDPKQLGRLGF